MAKKYINNLETGKIELHFEKEEYLRLQEEQKKELRGAYLFSGSAKAWVSRSKNNHYSAIRVAIKLGFTEEEIQGERLSYEEELNRKSQKAEKRVERYEQYSHNAEKRAENLQSEFNKHRGDIAFLTQPIIRGHAGSEAFAKRRNAIMDRYNKGYEEYRKSDYFKDRAKTAQATADKIQLKNKVYLSNRINECESNIRRLERNIIAAEEKGNEKAIENYLSEMEYQIDKKAFMENCLDELGGTFSKEDLKEGYLILIRHGWAKVKKLNPKTVTCEYIEHPLNGWEHKAEYAEIKKIKVPKNYTEVKKEIENPFLINDLVVSYNVARNRIIEAYQVMKTTSKTVTIQEVEIKENKPILNSFKGNKQERKTVKQDRQGNFVLNNDSWYLYKWTDKGQQGEEAV